MDAGEYLTESWEETEEMAPVPHAELLTLAELTAQLDLNSVDEITRKLENHKIIFENTNSQTLQEIASVNNTTPMDVYEIISKRAGNQMQGSGIGRKTLENFASELNRDIDEILQILEKNQIKAKRNQTLRDIGELNDLPPRDIYQLISE
jgi:hypothetical protein